MTLRRCGALIALAFALHPRAVEAQCVYNLGTTSASVPSIANVGSVSVVTGAICSWTAVSNDSWITIVSGASGTGLGTVGYNVAANATGSVRMGTLTIAGHTVTITQAANSCLYSLGTTSASVPSIANVGSVSVVAGASCSWTAVSNVGWITIVSGAGGTGLGTVGYNVAANTGAARIGTLTIAGKTLTINQAGAVSQTPPAAPKNLHFISQ